MDSLTAFDLAAGINEELTGSEFPLHVLPERLQKIIKAMVSDLGFPVEYISTSILMASSIAIGNTYKVKVKNGWSEAIMFYMALVGKPGVNKSAPKEVAMSPLMKKDQQSFRDFSIAKAQFDVEMEKKKKDYPAPQKPRFCKHLTQDFTIEALFSLMMNNSRGLGVVPDELATWFKNFNRYNSGKGSEQELWLIIWSNNQISTDRKNSDPTLISSPFVTVFGTMQPSVFQELASNGRGANGFIDRILFVYPENLVKNPWSDSEIDQSVLDEYEFFINQLTEIDWNHDNGETKPNILTFSDEAKSALYAWQAENTNNCNSEEGERYAGILAKMETYCIRFAGLLQIISDKCNNVQNVQGIIKIESVKGAIELIKYFIINSKRVYDTISGDPLATLDKNKLSLYNLLNNEFTTNDILRISKEIIPPIKSNKTINKLLNDNRLFEKISHGNYRKKIVG